MSVKKDLRYSLQLIENLIIRIYEIKLEQRLITECEFPFSCFRSEENIKMKIISVSQFRCCTLVWMSHSKSLDYRTYGLHKKSLQLFYKDFKSPFQQILEKNSTLTIHQCNFFANSSNKNIQFSARCKSKAELSKNCHRHERHWTVTLTYHRAYYYTEVYLESIQTSMMEHFAKIVNG